MLNIDIQTFQDFIIEIPKNNMPNRHSNYFPKNKVNRSIKSYHRMLSWKLKKFRF